jgi:hypothetical protein
VAHREQWWLIVSSGSSQGAVVAHREQWWLIREQCWLIGSSRGSLVAPLDCETAVLGSNPAISPAYSGLPVLRWAAIWDGSSL